MAIQVVILAAGKGKRMCSSLPKVLHLLAGKALIQHVIDTANRITADRTPIIVYGHQGDELRQALQQEKLTWVAQHEQLGTAHAVQQTLPHLKDDDYILILYGDVPLIHQRTLEDLIKKTNELRSPLGLVSTTVNNPQGYGRIKRDAQGEIIAIVEDKDATPADRAVCEINPGIYLVQAKRLKAWLPKIQNNNGQREFYLTDIVALAQREKISIPSVTPAANEEVLGVNDKLQLAHLERFYQLEQAKRWLSAGVTLQDPARFDVRGDVSIGQESVIDINVICEGNVSIGKHCHIGPHVILKDTVLADHVVIKSHSVIEGATIGEGSVIGPFARIRPETILAQAVHIGNFVEIKKSHIEQGSKVNHLSYIGDATVGRSVNIGAGTITCNYDGAHKHQTIIKDHVFIGSDTQLIAPVTVGENATIAAGSTIIHDVPAHGLTLTQKIEQRTIKSWQRPSKIPK